MKQPARLREDEKFHRGVMALLVPPDVDEEVQRNEHHFPEEVEEEQIDGEKDAGDRR